LNIVLSISDQYDATAKRDEIRMLHGNALPIRQANPEGRERALMQPLANGFCIQHRLPIVSQMQYLRKNA